MLIIPLTLTQEQILLAKTSRRLTIHFKHGQAGYKIPVDEEHIDVLVRFVEQNAKADNPAI